jgi:hypothetical protein
LTEQFLKHKTAGNVILLLDDHRTYCSSPLLLQTAVENNVTIIRLLSNYTHTLQPLQNYFKKTADCKINRYRVVRLIGFAWSKVASVGDDVSAFE